MFDDSPEQSSSSSPKKDLNLSGILSKLPMILGTLLVVIAVGAAGFFFIKYQNEKSRAQQLLGASAETPEQIKQLVDSVGKLIELPKGEQPTVATVSDKEKLSGQPFFANSQNGDKVLVYSKARIAVIYRPSTGKIINYATNITVGDQAATTPAPTGEEISGTPTAEPTVEPTVAPTIPVTSAPTAEPTIAPAQ